VLGLAFASCTVLFVPAMAGALPEASAAAVAGLPDFTDLVDKTGPAVVNIRTTQKIKIGGQNQLDDDQAQEFFRRFFGVPAPQQQQPQPRSKNRKPAPEEQEQEVDRGIGSGFIISGDGYVLTNAHVVDAADEVHVTMTDKREFKAKVIGADKDSDIALLKIDAANLPHLTLGDSDKIRAGEWAIAIGSPFGLDNTVTAGIISSKAREIGDYLKLIQTDVAVNPGNSGGPLLNMRGEVVGINSQIFSESGGYMGISFAVPINDAIRVSEQLKSAGKVTRGRLGIQIQDVTREVAESLNLPKAEGASVARVEPGSPAEKGGVQAGDIVIKYNGTPVESMGDLRRTEGIERGRGRSRSRQGHIVEEGWQEGQEGRQGRTGRQCAGFDHERSDRRTKEGIGRRPWRLDRVGGRCGTIRRPASRRRGPARQGHRHHRQQAIQCAGGQAGAQEGRGGAGDAKRRLTIPAVEAQQPVSRTKRGTQVPLFSESCP
jgi:serine protease Do